MDRNVNNMMNQNTASSAAAYPAYSGYQQPQGQQQQMQGQGYQYQGQPAYAAQPQYPQQPQYTQQPQYSQQAQPQYQGQVPVAADGSSAPQAQTQRRPRRFLPVEVGRGLKVGQDMAVSYAFHLECTVTKQPHYFPAKPDEDRPQSVTVNVALGSSPERIMALADGSYSRGSDYGPEDRNFGEVVAFGATADAVNQLSIGDTIAVAGPVGWREWTASDGRQGKTLSITADYIQLTRSRNVHPAVQGGFVAAAKLWTDRNGQERRDPMACLVTAEVVSAPMSPYTSQRGSLYLPLTLSLPYPAEQLYDAANGLAAPGKQYQDYRNLKAVLFNRTASALAGKLREGTQVCVTGTVTEDTYGGKRDISMSVRVMTILTQTAPVSNQPAPADYGAPAAYGSAPAGYQAGPATGYAAAPAPAPAPQGAPSGYAAAPAQPTGYAAAPATQTAAAQPYKADAADHFTDLQTGDDDLPF